MLVGSDWRRIATKLMTTAPEGAIQAKFFKTNSVKVQCIDMEIYKIAQKYFNLTNTEFHSLIKGLLPEISATEVVEELKKPWL